MGEGKEKGKRRAEKGESGISEGRAERPGIREDILGGGREWNKFGRSGKEWREV